MAYGLEGDTDSEQGASGEHADFDGERGAEMKNGLDHGGGLFGSAPTVHLWQDVTDVRIDCGRKVNRHENKRLFRYSRKPDRAYNRRCWTRAR